MSTLETLPLFLRASLKQYKAFNLNINETKVDCSNCYRCSKQYRGKYTYKPNLKCCTFYPFIPNFYVGAILSDSNLTEGSAVVREMIQNREYATPLGLTPPIPYQIKFINKKKTAFGNDAGLLCPYFNREKSNCNIWPYRGVVCTTYFCSSSYAAKGKSFWKGFSDYLSYIEMALMEECLVNLDFSPRDISNLLDYLNRKSASKDELKKLKLSEKEIKKIWNGYHSEIEDFYIKCFKFVQKLSGFQVDKVLGEHGKNLEKHVLEAYKTIKL